MKQRFALCFAILFCISMPAMAHPDAGAMLPGGFLNGILHPLDGADHLLAALAIGLLAVQHGYRPVLAVPITFLCGLFPGFILCGSGLHLPYIEQGIAFSVLLPGLLLAGSARLPLPVILLLTGLLANLHGYAHAADVRDAAWPQFVAGLIIATALLHACGMALAFIVKKHALPTITRFAGAAIAIIGGCLLFA